MSRTAVEAASNLVHQHPLTTLNNFSYSNDASKPIFEGLNLLFKTAGSAYLSLLLQFDFL